jgi:hypothetical protein
MTDLLALLGDEWAPRAAPVAVAECSHEDRLDATHGCRSCGRAPTTWSEVLGSYIDGMGRITRCGYCTSCVGSGRTSVRDPWTDELLDWAGAPCRRCAGTGWTEHAWDCGPDHHRHHMGVHELAPATVWGVTFDGRTVFPGDLV